MYDLFKSIKDVNVPHFGPKAIAGHQHRCRTCYGIASFFRTGIRLTECRTVRHSGIHRQILYIYLQYSTYTYAYAYTYTYSVHILIRISICIYLYVAVNLSVHVMFMYMYLLYV
jgi:hypothetical protein